LKANLLLEHVRKCLACIQVTVVNVQKIHLLSSTGEFIFTLHNKVFTKPHLYFFPFFQARMCAYVFGAVSVYCCTSENFVQPILR